MTEPRNEEILNLVRSYVERALEVFPENYQEIDDHFREIEEWLPAEGDAFRKETREELDPWIFLYRIRETLHSLPEYTTAREALLADSVFGPQLDRLVGTVLGGHRVESEGFLDGLIVQQLRRGSFDFDEEVLLESYLQAESAFYKEELSFTLLLPLVGLTIEDAPIELAPGLELDRLSEEEIGACLELDLLPLPFPAYGGVTFVDERLRFGLRHKYSLPKRVGSEVDDESRVAAARLLEEQEAMLDSVVQSLRLLKPGTVTPAGRITTATSWFLRGIRNYGQGLHSPGVWGNDFPLSKSEAALLVDLRRKLTSEVVRKRRALMLAIRRFSQADERTLADDKMLDLMIAAEALFLSDSGREEDRGELSYRLSLRAGYLLGSNPASRREVFGQMRRAYRARSKIAHGGEMAQVKLEDGTEVDLHTFAKSVHQLMREAIRAVLDSVQPNGPMVDWESLIFGD